VGATSLEYNALGLSPVDGYMYAFETGSNTLLRVASDGSAVNLGPVAGLPAPGIGYVSGAFDPSGNLWVVDQGNAGHAFEINVGTTPPHVVTQLPFVGPAINATDWTYDYGSMWGLDAPGGLDRVDLATGVVTVRHLDDDGAQPNAAWTCANGDLGFESGTGDIAPRISGIPIQTFTVTVYNGEPSYNEADGTSCWPALQVQLTSSDGTYGTAYSQQVNITGGTGPYTVVQSSGQLPPGLTLGPDGTLSGIPTAAGTYTFGVQVTDTAAASGIGSITVTIDPAPLVITASSGTMTYHGNVPAITPSYSGFVNGDTASVLLKAPICSTTATSSSPVGTYPSSCTGASGAFNYDISYVSGTVHVDLATLTITASSASISYGDTTPAITASYSGFVDGDTPASLTDLPACAAQAPAAGAPAEHTPPVAAARSTPTTTSSMRTGP
jgi:hypothetical protein